MIWVVIDKDNPDSTFLVKCAVRPTSEMIQKRLETDVDFIIRGPLQVEKALDLDE